MLFISGCLNGVYEFSTQTEAVIVCIGDLARLEQDAEKHISNMAGSEIKEVQNNTANGPPPRERLERAMDSQRTSLKSCSSREMSKLCVKLFVVSYVVLLCVTVTLVLFEIGSFSTNSLVSHPKNNHLTKSQLRDYFDAKCPALGKTQSCNPQCQKIWTFYAVIATPLINHCGQYMYGEKGFDECVHNLVNEMSKSAFDVQNMLESISHYPYCTCGANKQTFSLLHLLTQCPYHEHQYHTAIATGSTVDAICMRPGGTVNALIVPRPANEYPLDDDSMCTNCSVACTTSYQNYRCCHGTCRDITSDDNNCGFCGNICATNEKCQESVCQKVMGDTCNSGSREKQSDETQTCKNALCLDSLKSSDEEIANCILSCQKDGFTHRVDFILNEDDGSHISHTDTEVCTIAPQCNPAYFVGMDIVPLEQNAQSEKQGKTLIFRAGQKYSGNTA